MRDSYSANPEAKKQTERDRYEANPEAKKQKERDSYNANPEAKKREERDSYKANPDGKKKNARENYEKNKEQRKSTMQKYYRENRSHLLFDKMAAYYSTSGLSKRAARLMLRARKYMTERKQKIASCSFMSLSSILESSM